MVASYGNRDDKMYLNWVKESPGSVSLVSTTPLEQHFDVVACCDWDWNQSTFVAFGGKDGLVSLWRVQAKRQQTSRLLFLHANDAPPDTTLEHLFTGFKAGIESVCVDASNALLFTVDTTETLYIHSIESGASLWIVELKPLLLPLAHASCKHVHTVAMASNGRGDCFVLVRFKTDSKVKHALFLVHCNGVVVAQRLIEEETLLPQLLVCRDGDHYLYCRKSGICVGSVMADMTGEV